MEDILVFDNVDYAYKQGVDIHHILQGATYSFKKGVFYAIVGPSGSGKTTAISLAAGLDEAQNGAISFEQKDIKKIGFNKYRKKNVTIVFQSYNLLSYMTPLQNILAAMEIGQIKTKNNTEYALEMLQKIGIDNKMATRNVKLLSGGQQQRVAIARALCKESDFIVADEPTGNLDKKTANEIIKIFKEIAHDKQKCFITVTHSNTFARAADIILEIKNGKLVEKR